MHCLSKSKRSRKKENNVFITPNHLLTNGETFFPSLSVCVCKCVCVRMCRLLSLLFLYFLYYLSTMFNLPTSGTFSYPVFNRLLL